jgi:hypothetical protein
MLDWFTGVVGCDASHLTTDKVCRIEPTGHIAWESNCWFDVKGSYESSIQVRQSDVLSRWVAAFKHDQMTLGYPVMQMSGNPVKFLQGHNAFGPSVELWQPVVTAAIKAFPDSVRPADALDNISFAMWPSRIDIAVSVDMGSYENVREWLRCISTNSRIRRGRALLAGETVYWGQHSRRWSLKSYCKYDEMGVHPMGDLSLNSQFRESVRSILRLELCLRSLELRDLEKKGVALNESLLWDYFENKITIGALSMSKVKDLDVLSLPHQAILMRWLKGEDVSKLLKVSTFYRYRRIILDNFGADISIPCQDQESMLERVQFDIKYLREHEVKVVPDIFAGRILGSDSFNFSSR